MVLTHGSLLVIKELNEAEWSQKNDWFTLSIFEVNLFLYQLKVNEAMQVNSCPGPSSDQPQGTDRWSEKGAMG